MQTARAEFVDHLPAQRSLALVRRDDEAILLLRKGEISEQAGQELAELVQILIDNNRADGAGGHAWPPIATVN